MKTKIAHLTSAHPRYDTRIFVKMCSSLATIGDYRVFLVVADGKGNESKNNLAIIDTGAKEGGRISRMTKTVQRVYQQAKELDCDIYHLHDPELIPIGIKLKKLGKKVIFDAHEDLPKQILGKFYLHSAVRVILSKGFEYYEKYTCAKFDAIVAATPYIRDKFLNINKNSIDINNFPKLEEFNNDITQSDKKDEVCYIGTITASRGIKEIVEAIGLTSGIRLNLAGKFNEKNVKSEVEAYAGWSRVNDLGFLDRQGVSEVLSRSKAGLVTLHPLINYVDALPVKMFEYMAAGLPVIASDIALWRDIVESSQCGLCVNPLESKEIAEAIEYIVTNPTKAQQMGENGKQAIHTQYNWHREEQKLFDLYKKLL